MQWERLTVRFDFTTVSIFRPQCDITSLKILYNDGWFIIVAKFTTIDIIS